MASGVSGVRRCVLLLHFIHSHVHIERDTRARKKKRRETTIMIRAGCFQSAIYPEGIFYHPQAFCQPGDRNFSASLKEGPRQAAAKSTEVGAQVPFFAAAAFPAAFARPDAQHIPFHRA